MKPLVLEIGNSNYDEESTGWNWAQVSFRGLVYGDMGLIFLQEGLLGVEDSINIILFILVSSGILYSLLKRSENTD